MKSPTTNEPLDLLSFFVTALLDALSFVGQSLKIEMNVVYTRRVVSHWIGGNNSIGKVWYGLNCLVLSNLDAKVTILVRFWHVDLQRFLLCNIKSGKRFS